MDPPLKGSEPSSSVNPIHPESSDAPLELPASFATMAKRNACAFAVGWLTGTSGINPFVLIGL